MKGPSAREREYLSKNPKLCGLCEKLVHGHRLLWPEISVPASTDRRNAIKAVRKPKTEVHGEEIK